MTDAHNGPGSIWRRWDPHIHAPGTVLNDQFGTDNSWEKYLTKLETSSPAIEAVGITDYYSLEVYEKICASRDSGRLRNVGLIFPNIELRYGVGTDKGSPVNFHLLISPEDKDHVKEAKRFLQRLTYKHSNGDTYSCTRDDLIGLGKAHEGKALDDDAAHAVGANQFKVEVDHFLEQWADSPWIQKNALIAVAVGSNDGTAGLQKDASLSSLRQKIESAAHIIFSAQTKQREFWLGEGTLTSSEIQDKYGSCKPCIHGSDAHDLDHVGTPDLERYCWIKGDATFDALRQACMEPNLRVRIDAAAPEGAYASQTIDYISMKNAPWFGDVPIKLNSGLVGIIGARGSGKSALADMIAAGGFDLSSHLSESSFVYRAGNLLEGSESILTWRDGSTSASTLDFTELENNSDSPKVQYLSQQFVERLCSARGATQELIAEIERVIFNTHAKEDRLGTDNFQELLSLKARRGREARTRHEEALSGIGGRIAKERDKKDDLAGNNSRLTELRESVKKQKEERAKLIPKKADAHASTFETVSKAANTVRNRIDKAKRRSGALEVLADHVQAFRDRLADDELANLKSQHSEAELEEKDWSAFKTKFEGDVDSIIATSKKNASGIISKLTGETQNGDQNAENVEPSTISLLPSGATLEELPLNLLEQEETRLRLLMGIDADKRKKHERLSEKIRLGEQQITRLTSTIEAAGKADDEIKKLNTLRNDSYKNVFVGIVSEESALQDLYQPLADRLVGATGALGSLKFSIRRRVTVADWAKRGEALIDKRMAGDFKGLGSLMEAAEKILAESWRAGTANEVTNAMSVFRSKYNDTIRNAANINKNDVAAMRRWGANVSEWLYSTDHIQISYGMQYDGVEIETLSPGTRGIVLLLLYLAIDTDDDRPLIIDQPEENLDPKSIFDELVVLFRKAKLRRQIIIVTHNANLIVNTDADQVIVAECGSIKSGELPKISYISGSLEDPIIRKHVCDILEGGERAFLERAKRLRVTISK